MYKGGLINSEQIKKLHEYTKEEKLKAEKI